MSNSSIFLCIVILVFINFSCQKKIDPQPIEDGLRDAWIIDTGSIVVDGCGWKVWSDSVIHNPVNLSVEYMIDSLEVGIEFTILEDSSTCPMGFIKIPDIHIDTIRVRR